MEYRLKSLDAFGNAMKKQVPPLEDSQKTLANFAPFVARDKSNLLESTTKYFVQDLIGEGPIAGLVDPKGNELVLFDKGVNNSEIFKGVYYNNYPVKNFHTNQFNYSRLEMYGRFGTEFQSYLPIYGLNGFTFSNPGVSYSIEKTLYGITDDISINFFHTARHVSVFQLIKGGAANFTIGAKLINGRQIFTEANFEKCFGAYHEIKDPSTDYLFLSFKLNALYTVGGDGSTGTNTCLLGIEIGYKLNPLYKCYVLHKVTGIATSPYAFDLFFDVSDFDFALGPYIKVYNLSKANDPADFKSNRSVGVSYVTEVTSLTFKYPNSCYFLSVFDGRGFSQPPNRTYDLKLLKIKVPENYDAEGKYYDGFWNGEFDSVLRWTDNPAWIIYDLITNYRYGLGKFTFQESLADKWNLYRIAKYCDESVPTNNVSRFPAVNILSLHAAATGTPAGPSGSVSDAKDNVKNIIRLSHSSSMNGFFNVGYKLDLVSLKFLDTDEDGQQINVFKSFRVIITSVKFEDPATQTCAQIGFIPEFGLHKIFSKFPDVKKEIEAILGSGSGDDANQYETAMKILINAFTAAAALSPDNPFFNFINYIKNLSVFPDLEYVYNSGKAAAQFPGFFPLTEPRFRANISLITETDVINLLNNVASTFKGLTYWSNNFVNFDNDRPKPSCYFFTNSNVKDGIFNYIGSSKDTRYTVAKIVYADETDGFKDKTVYVEDQINIRRYGYVEKEILGFGVTSKSQARRIGEWFLITNQIEKELVIFTAGPEALLLSPGNVISITDELKVSGRKGGRVVSIVNNIIVLDDKYDFIQGGDILSFIIPTESITPSYLNKKSNEGKEISDSEIDKLNAVYLYKFEVEGTGLDGNFRTQITLKTSGLTDAEQNILFSIAPSTLWVYDKDDSNPSVAYSKQYRILGIKEKSQVEFEITAAEYEVTKFNYIENKQSLSTNNLFSENTSNITQIIPKNQVPDIDVSRSDYVSNVSQTFNINDRYDYIIPSFDYSDDKYSSVVSVLKINNGKLFNDFKDVNNTGSTACVGLVIEYVLNSKKISYVWRVGDAASTTIARPINEVSISFESLRVYKIGINDEFLN